MHSCSSSTASIIMPREHENDSHHSNKIALVYFSINREKRFIHKQTTNIHAHTHRRTHIHRRRHTKVHEVTHQGARGDTPNRVHKALLHRITDQSRSAGIKPQTDRMGSATSAYTINIIDQHTVNRATLPTQYCCIPQGFATWPAVQAANSSHDRNWRNRVRGAAN